MKAVRYIDLTQSVNNEMKGVGIESATRKSVEGWNASTLHLYSHSGTHMDAPWHFEVNEQTIDEFPIERFFVDTWVVDMAPAEPRQLIQVSDLGLVRDQVKKGEGIILKTDWSLRAGTEIYRDGLPRISEELAKWLGQSGISLIGVEGPSVADVNNLEEVTRIHEILLSNDIIIVEGLTNLNQITRPRVQLIALPLKVQKGDGAPARVIAVEM